MIAGELADGEVTLKSRSAGYRLRPVFD